jgi:hypothetical protein
MNHELELLRNEVDTLYTFACRDWTEPRNSLVRIAGFRPIFDPRNLPNTKWRSASFVEKICGQAKMVMGFRFAIVQII